MEIIRTGKDRKIHCSHCGDIVNRSILPHIREKHPKIWETWKKRMLDLYSSGLSPKQIMKQEFNTLFTWKVIEKEIQKMNEQLFSKGRDIKVQIKDKIEKWEPDNEQFFSELDNTTIWRFKKRGEWATHKGNYRGNWPPQIPRYFILNYSEPGDLVFDGFMGGGTTIIECRLLGRDAIGYDINPVAFKFVKKQLEIIRKECKRQKIGLPNSNIKIGVRDIRKLDNIPDNSIDLICTHPPYYNSLKYTHSVEGDLSHINDINIFLDELSLIAKDFYRILKDKKICVILIGDIKINKNTYPLGFSFMERFIKSGFTLKEIVIKEQYNDRSTEFYVRANIRRINHEYLFLFQKLIT